MASSSLEFVVPDYEQEPLDSLLNQLTLGLSPLGPGCGVTIGQQQRSTSIQPHEQLCDRPQIHYQATGRSPEGVTMLFPAEWPAAVNENFSEIPTHTLVSVMQEIGVYNRDPSKLTLVEKVSQVRVHFSED